MEVDHGQGHSLAVVGPKWRYHELVRRTGIPGRKDRSLRFAPRPQINFHQCDIRLPLQSKKPCLLLFPVLRRTFPGISLRCGRTPPLQLEPRASSTALISRFWLVVRLAATILSSDNVVTLLHRHFGKAYRTAAIAHYLAVSHTFYAPHLVIMDATFFSDNLDGQYEPTYSSVTAKNGNFPCAAK